MKYLIAKQKKLYILKGQLKEASYWANRFRIDGEPDVRDEYNYYVTIKPIRKRIIELRKEIKRLKLEIINK
jgi:hypothetical protein